MCVRNHHHMPRRVRVGVQNDETPLASIDNTRLGIIATRDCLAENALRNLSRGRNVGVAPRSPEVIHSRRLADATHRGELARHLLTDATLPRLNPACNMREIWV